MINWKQLYKDEAKQYVGNHMLLRESYLSGKNVNHLVGVLRQDIDGVFFLFTDEGNRLCLLFDTFTYYFVLIDEILM